MSSNSFPSPATVQSRGASRAFSLVELLSVVSIMGILAGLTVPAVRGLTGAASLNAGTRKFADLLNLARSEAIVRHTIVRFVIVRDWEKNEDFNLRKVGLWAWDQEVKAFLPMTGWQELPIGIVLEPVLPDYVRKANYAAADSASVRGDCVLQREFANTAEFTVHAGDESISTRYIEFLPSGNLRIPGSSARHAIFVATQGFRNSDGSLTYTSPADGHPANWTQVNVDTLTGRARVYQP
jgi:prepilin-type N-terminal cleavage/methylation domain-containing protein